MLKFIKQIVISVIAQSIMIALAYIFRNEDIWGTILVVSCFALALGLSVWLMRIKYLEEREKERERDRHQRTKERQEISNEIDAKLSESISVVRTEIMNSISAHRKEKSEIDSTYREEMTKFVLGLNEKTGDKIDALVKYAEESFATVKEAIKELSKPKEA